VRVPDRWHPLAAVLGAAAFLGLYGAFLAGGPCGFKVLTGAPCPGCGMTRSVGALLRGDLAASLRFHPLGLASAAAFAAALGLGAAEAASGRPHLRDAARRAGLRLALAAVVLLGGIWVARVFVHPAWSPDPIPPGSLAGRLLGR